MQWSDIQFHPNDRTLRQFAGLWLGFFGLMAAWQLLVRERPTLAIVLGGLALAVGLPGLFWPKLLRPLYDAWMVLAFPIGWTVSQAILALTFYGLFTPISLIFRLIGRDPLDRRPQPSAVSYWVPKASPTDPRRYFKQF